MGTFTFSPRLTKRRRGPSTVACLILAFRFRRSSSSLRNVFKEAVLISSVSSASAISSSCVRARWVGLTFFGMAAYRPDYSYISVCKVSSLAKKHTRFSCSSLSLECSCFLLRTVAFRLLFRVAGSTSSPVASSTGMGAVYRRLFLAGRCCCSSLSCVLSRFCKLCRDSFRATGRAPPALSFLRAAFDKLVSSDIERRTCVLHSLTFRASRASAWIAFSPSTASSSSSVLWKSWSYSSPSASVHPSPS